MTLTKHEQSAEGQGGVDQDAIAIIRSLMRDLGISGHIIGEVGGRYISAEGVVEALAVRTSAEAELVEALEEAAIELWEDSDGVRRIDPWVRCDWSEISERSREIWRGKALSNAVLAFHKGEAA